MSQLGPMANRTRPAFDFSQQLAAIVEIFPSDWIRRGWADWAVVESTAVTGDVPA